MPTHDVSINYEVIDHASASLHTIGEAAKGAASPLERVEHESARASSGLGHLGNAATHAHGPLDRIKHAAHAAGEGLLHMGEHALEMGREAITSTAAQMGLVLGLDGLKDKMIEVGKEFEETKESIAGIQFVAAAWNKATPPVERMNIAMEASGEIFEDLEKISYQYAEKVGDVSRAYEVLALTAGKTGMKQERLIGLTKMTSAAARVFKTDTSDAGDVVGKAILTGMIRPTGEFGKYLRMVDKDHRFHALGVVERTKRVEKALRDLGPAAEAMSHGFGDSMFRIGEDVAHLIREVTAPLFEDISNSKEGLAATLHNFVTGPDGLEKMKEVGEGIVAVFHELREIIKDDIEFVKGLVDNIPDFVKERLKSKGTHEAASNLGAATQHLGKLQMGENLGAGFDEEGARMAYNSLLAGGLVKAGGVAGVESSRETIHGAMTGMDESEFLRMQEQMTGDGKAIMFNNRDEAESFLTDLIIRKTEAELEAFPMIAKQVSDRVSEEKKALPGRTAKDNNVIAKFGDLHVTMDFKDQDPERVFIRFKERVESYAENRLQSALGEKYGPGNG